MIYDVCAHFSSKEGDQDKDYQLLVNASSVSHLKLLLDKNLPKGTEIFNLSVNKDINQVQIVNPKGDKVIKVISVDKIDNLHANQDYCESGVSETYCIANSITEVLSKIVELGYDGDIIEISIFTPDVKYIY